MKKSKDPSPTKSETNSTTKDESSTSRPLPQYLINFLLFLLAILIGILIQRYIDDNRVDKLQNQEHVAKKPSEPLIDMEKLYKEMAEIKRELEEAKRPTNINTDSKSTKSQIESKRAAQDDIINENQEVKKGVIGEEVLVDDSAYKLQSEDGKPLKIDLSEIQRKQQLEKEREEKIKTAEAELKRKKIQEAKEKNRLKKEKKLEEDQEKDAGKHKAKEADALKKSQDEQSQSAQTKTPSTPEVPVEVKNFQSTKINQIKTKKMWIPIPNRFILLLSFHFQRTKANLNDFMRLFKQWRSSQSSCK